MKFLLLGDTHITDRKPERRKDLSYLDTILGKLNQIEQVGIRYKCGVVLQSGDWYDSWRVGSNVTCEMISFLKKSKMEWFCIWGQHDIYGHSAESFSYSSLRILQEAAEVKVLGEEPKLIPSDYHTPDVYLYGASFGQEIPKVVIPKAYNVLIVHQMIGDVPLYPDQELVHPAAFLRKYPNYNLVLAGDYHYRFISQFGGRTCVNPGALVRKTIKEEDLNLLPAVVVFDTDTNDFEIVELKITPSEEIFDLEVKIEKEDPNYERLLAFLENIKRSTNTSVGWKKILSELIAKEKVPDRVIELIDNCVAEVEGVK